MDLKLNLYFVKINKRLLLISLTLMFLSGCATTPSHDSAKDSSIHVAGDASGDDENAREAFRIGSVNKF